MARAVASMLLMIVVTACADPGTSETSVSGEELAAAAGCLACHGVADTDTGPSLHGIWGTQSVLTDGRTATVDETYVRESITSPAADVVDGYGATMPIPALDDDEVEQLVEWVRSLG